MANEKKKKPTCPDCAEGLCPTPVVNQNNDNKTCKTCKRNLDKLKNSKECRDCIVTSGPLNHFPNWESIS